MRDVGGALDEVPVLRQGRGRRWNVEDVASCQIQRHLVAFLIELIHDGLLSGVLRPELVDAVKLIGEDTAHAERGPGQKAMLDTFVEPIELAGFRNGHG